jgi:hypothetical protein
MFLSATINDKPVARAYTPVSSDDDIGRFDLVVKVYSQGNMSKHLDTLKIGDTILVQGPRGRLTYAGMGEFMIRGADGMESRKVKRVGMMAGGTGITPMLQVSPHQHFALCWSALIAFFQLFISSNASRFHATRRAARRLMTVLVLLFIVYTPGDQCNLEEPRRSNPN